MIDLAAIVALVYTSGAPNSQTAMAFYVLPVVAAARMRPVITLRWAATVVAAYVAISLAHPNAATEGAIGRVVAQAAYLGWIGFAAAVLSQALSRGAMPPSRVWRRSATSWRRTRCAACRRSGAAWRSCSTTSRSRRSRSPSTSWWTTGARAARRRSSARSALQDTIEQLRRQIFELHPYVVDHAGMRLGVAHFALLVLGTNLTFFPMHILGWEGMPRRVAE